MQFLTFNIFRGQQRDVLSDEHSFSQTYKSIDIIKKVNQETWLQQRNKVVKAAVDGMSDGSVSKFQKCVPVEHLYSLAGNGQFVLPFGFLVNLMMFTITNSKLALSVVSKILPGGSYYTVTSWRDSLASVPCPFPSGDCVTALIKKWRRIKVMLRLSIKTYIKGSCIDPR